MKWLGPSNQMRRLTRIVLLGCSLLVIAYLFGSLVRSHKSLVPIEAQVVANDPDQRTDTQPKTPETTAPGTLASSNPDDALIQQLRNRNLAAEARINAATALAALGSYSGTVAIAEALNKSLSDGDSDLQGGLLAAVAELRSLATADALSDVLIDSVPGLRHGEFSDDILLAFEKALRSMAVTSAVQTILYEKYNSNMAPELRTRLLVIGDPFLNSQAALLHYAQGETAEADRSIRYLARSRDSAVLGTVLEMANRAEGPLDQLATSAYSLANLLPLGPTKEYLSSKLSEPEMSPRSKIIAAAGLCSSMTDDSTRSALAKALLYETNVAVAGYYRQILDTLPLRATNSLERFKAPN